MSVRGHRSQIAVLIVGYLISTTGDAAAFVALVLRVQPYGSTWVSALLAAEFIPPVLVSAYAGRLVDRVESRRVLLLGIAGQAVVVAALAFVAAPAAAVVMTALLAVLASAARPASAALVPVIAGEDGAATAYGRLATARMTGWLVGPAIGGALVAGVGVSGTLLLNAITFVLLLIAAASLAVRRPPAEVEGEDDDEHASLSGMRLLLAEPVLRISVVVTAVVTAASVVDNVAAPFKFVDELGSGSFGYGLYQALWAVGGLIALQWFNRRDSHRHAVVLLAAGNCVTGLGIFAIGLSPTLYLALTATVLGGMGNGVSGVSESIVVQSSTPPEARGRAFGTLDAVLNAAIVLGTVAGAPVVAGLGGSGAMVAAGGVAGLLGALGIALVWSRARGPVPPVPADATVSGPDELS